MLSIAAWLWTALPAQADDDQCKTLHLMYCTSCHNSQRTCDGLGNKDDAAWKKTLAEMGEYGDIDQGTQDKIRSCLVKMEKGDPAVCPK